MVPFAEREHVGDVGRSPVLPPRDVMDPARLEAHLAAGMTTRSVHRSKGTALFAGGEASGSAVIEGNAVPAEHDGDDLGVAGESADRRDRQLDPVSGLGNGGLMDALDEGVVVDQHDDFRDPPIRGPGTDDQIDEGVGSEVLEAHVVLSGRAGRLDGGIEGGRDAGVGLRVELEVGVAHPALSIDPPTNPPLPLQPFEVTGSVVTGQDPRQLPDLPFERLHRRAWPLTRRGSIRARRAQRDRRRRAVRRRGRAHRHDRPTPCRPPERHGPPASGRTPHLGGPPGVRRALPADHRTPTSPRHPHPSPSRPAGWRGWRSARPARRANHAPARKPAPTRRGRPGRTSPGRHTSTDGPVRRRQRNACCNCIEHMFDCQGRRRHRRRLRRSRSVGASRRYAVCRGRTQGDGDALFVQRLAPCGIGRPRRDGLFGDESAPLRTGLACQRGTRPS